MQTRPDELEKLENQVLKAKAHLIDEKLNQCRFQTIIHGDAKLANFCFSKHRDKVAAVDFQYVGGGCGIKDVAYFLGSCLDGKQLVEYEKELMDFYFLNLRSAIENNNNEINSNFNFIELEKEWRQLYPIAVTDFTRFLLGWMPTHQKINQYNLDMMDKVLAEL